MRVALCFLLPLLANGVIIGVASQTQIDFEIDSMDVNGNHTKILDLEHVSTAATLRNDNTLVYCTEVLSSSGGGDATTGYSFLSTVDLATKQTKKGPHFHHLYFGNLEFDKLTAQTFTIAFNASTNLTSMFEVLSDGTLMEMLQISASGDLDPDVPSTYSSSKHIFFLAAANWSIGAPQNLLAMSTVGQPKILYNVSIPVWISSMAFDDIAGVLYLLGTSSTATILFSLDYTSGQPIRTFYQTTAFDPDNVCINSAGTELYSTLYDLKKKHPVLHTLQVATGNFTIININRYFLTMNFQ